MKEGPENRYQKLGRVEGRDGFVPVDDEGNPLEDFDSEHEDDEFENAEEESVDLGRRGFLKAVAAGAMVAGAGIVGKELLQNDKDSRTSLNHISRGTIDVRGKEPSEPESKETVKGKGLYEQLEEFGEIVDMGEVEKKMYDEHYYNLVRTPEGRNRLAGIKNRFKRYDISALEAEFEKRNLPRFFAIGIPAHESDFKSQTSPAGALGTHQFMPKTIKAMRHKKEDAYNVPMANLMTAEYMKDEKSRFGDDLYMHLRSFNAGAGMTGLSTFKKDPSKSTVENYHDMVAGLINRVFKKLEREGRVDLANPVYEDYRIKKGDTMWGISKLFGIDMKAICDRNNIDDPNKIDEGDILEIPYKNALERELKKEMPNTFQALEYAPRLVAMYDALAHFDYVEPREKGRSTGTMVAKGN